MRVMLINANRCHQPWPVMPIGLCYVASSLEAAGHAVLVLDLCFASRPASEIAAALDRFAPQVVGVSIRNLDNCVGAESRLFLDDIRRDVMDPLRRTFHGPIVLGGTAPGIAARQLLGAFDLEFAVRGDGEQALVALLGRIDRGETPTGIPGVVIRRRNAPAGEPEIVEDNDPAPPTDLNALPWPRVHRHLDLAAYRRFRSPLQVQSKRGCALACAYCTYNRIEGRAYRLRDPAQTALEIEDMVKTTGIRHVEFVDSTFNIPLDHAKAVLRAIIARGLRLDLRTMGLNPGAVDEELVELMAHAGFRDLDVGADAGTDATLAGLAKNFPRADLVRTGRLLRKRGISAHWFLILGGPNETRETAEETFATMAEVAGKWDVVGFNVGVRVYDGSPLADQLRRESPGCSKDDFLSPFTYQPRDITLEELRSLAREAVRRHPNFMLYDEVDRAPAWTRRALAFGFNALHLRAPIWKAYVLGRRMGRFVRPAPKTRPAERTRQADTNN